MLHRSPTVRPIIRILAASWLALLGAPLGLHLTASAQGPVPLYLPRAIKLDYVHGTRSPDGMPGPNYWQNHASYRIDVHAAPPDPTIRGDEQIVYANNSPDTLRTLVFKLFVNIHKPGAPRDGWHDARTTSPRACTSTRSRSTAGRRRGATIANIFTWKRVRLATPLPPHDSIQLSFSWHYDVSNAARPRGDDRLHHVLPGVLLSARRRLRRLQRLGHDGFHRPAGVLQRLQRLRRLDARCRRTMWCGAPVR